MGDRYYAGRLRIALTAGLLALVLGAAACGGSDDSDSGDDSAAAQGRSQDGGAAATGPEGEIRAAYGRFVDGLYDKDAKVVCEVFGPVARAQATTKRGESCEEGLDAYLAGIGTLSKNRPYVVKLRVDRSRAILYARTKTSSVYPVPFAKLGGEWKINGQWRG